MSAPTELKVSPALSFNNFILEVLAVVKLLKYLLTCPKPQATTSVRVHYTPQKNQCHLFFISCQLFELKYCVYFVLISQTLQQRSSSSSVTWPGAYKIFQAIQAGPGLCSTNPSPGLLRCPFREILLSALNREFLVLVQRLLLPPPPKNITHNLQFAAQN